ncbi:MAG: valine--tRNA ligase [Candidatus Latescibacteria bacterium]|nr:valine--tRNA ligase [Candidatus Latescibacterota bacterium]
MDSTSIQMDKVYNPKTVESRWYAFWEQGGYFRAERKPGAPRFSITIPPPNVTGELHMGHALQHTLHDTVTRYKRMQGFVTLCLPGTDHAGIATQMRAEQLLYKEEGKSRFDLGRDEMLKRIWAWREKYGGLILKQFRALGCSYDWSRERFTLDEGYARAVLEAFVRFYQKGWVYRGRRMVNWCPSCKTVISDLEVEEETAQGHLWHIRYPGADGGPDVVVATTRPETMLGDTGVAVHPTDARWKDAIGRHVRLPLMDRLIPIVADDYADPKMGSGAVKVTPAHDPNDYEVGQRHHLPEILVIGLDARMTPEAGPYAGMDRYDCRKAVVEALQGQGLLVRIEDYEHMVPRHDKCKTVIEPLPMEQWFVSMRALADHALPVLERNEIAYVPDRFRGYSVDWLKNIRDWCVSRQIWWGHRIPVWTCRACHEIIVQVDAPTACPKCQSADLEQDPDVLDTWFSSALWPFATLGWPEKTEDLRYFHPTDLMITGRDILYLWVARMIMTAVEFKDEVPFRTVLVHPTVQTKDGRRMSKSLGTGIDPMELIDKYGTDATRFSLLLQCGSSQDIRFDADVVDNVVQDSPTAEACRNFCNKIWNATRFVLMNLEGQPDLTLADRPTELADRWIMSRYGRTVQRVTEALDVYRFDEAARALHDFVWSEWCDWYLEMVKGRLNGDDAQSRATAQAVLARVLEGTLRLLHPMMPFISEEVWQQVPHQGETLMVAAWPKADESHLDAEAEWQVGLVQEIVGAVRNIRGEMRVPPVRRADLLIRTESPEVRRVVEANRAILADLARVGTLTVGADVARPPESASAVLKDAELYVPLKGLIDLDLERTRLQKEIDRLTVAITGIDKKLANAGFVAKAPTDVVERERQKRNECEASLTRLRENLTALTA